MPHCCGAYSDNGRASLIKYHGFVYNISSIFFSFSTHIFAFILFAIRLTETICKVLLKKNARFVEVGKYYLVKLLTFNGCPNMLCCHSLYSLSHLPASIAPAQYFYYLHALFSTQFFRQLKCSKK